jgi:putative acetyltransferase
VGGLGGRRRAARGRAPPPLLGLGPLGVLPARQGRGVGHALVHAGLAAADALDEPAVVLLGAPAYYGRFGFAPAARHGVRSPEPAWGEHLQVRRLTAWSARCAGPFAFAPPFDEAPAP